MHRMRQSYINMLQPISEDLILEVQGFGSGDGAGLIRNQI